MEEEEKLDRAANVISEAEALVITAGAGMGVDSGLPDFRGTHGFWRAYPVIAKLGLEFEEMANPVWFDRDPTLAWAFYGHRRNLYRSTVPHAGFRQLLEWGAAKPFGAFVFTSNVDAHFVKSGFSANRLIECHGSLEHLQCCKPCCEDIWEADDRDIDIDPETFRCRGELPQCPRCGGLARPNVLMFGDWSWLPNRTTDQRKGLESWLRAVAKARPRVVILEFGAGTAVPSVRNFSEQNAAPLGATLIRFNPRESQVPEGHIGLSMGALDGIRAIASRLS